MPSWTIHMTQTVRVDARTEHAARAAARRVIEQQPARLKVPAPIGQESLVVIESVDSAESTEADSWWDGYLLGWRHALDLDVLPPADDRRLDETEELHRLADHRDASSASPVRPTVDSDAGRAGLPVGTVVRSREGSIACRFNHDLGVVFGDDRPFPWSALELPLTILYSPANSRWLPPTQSTDSRSTYGEQR